MSAGGSLFAVGLALLFAGFYRAVAGPRPLDGAALLALGVAVMGAACELSFKGV